MADDLSNQAIGPYLLIQRLAVNPRSEVYLAQHNTPRRKVTVQLQSLPPEAPTEFLARQARWSQFEHPYCWPLLDYGVQQDIAYTVRPYFSNYKTLSQTIESLSHSPSFFLRYLPALQIGVALASALDAAHARGLVHGSLDADSLFWDEHENLYIRHWGNPDPPQAAYLAPEQWEGVAPQASSDRYSLAVLLYRLLAGHLPSEGAEFSPTLPDLSFAGQNQALAEVFLTALAASPPQRYPSAGQFIRSLRQALEDLATAKLPQQWPTKGFTVRWSSDHAQVRSLLDYQHQIPIAACAWIPNSKAFLFADKAGQMYEGSLDSGVYRPFASADCPVLSLNLGGLGDSLRVASAHEDGSLAVWDGEGGLIKQWMGHQGRALQGVLSSDGTSLASVGEDGWLRLWNVPDGQLSRSWEAHPGGINCCALSEQGQIALTGGADGLLKLWSVQDGRLLQTFTGHRAMLTTCDFKGELILSGDSLGEVRVWDIMQQDQTLILKGHQAAVTTCHIEMLGEVIGGLTCSADGTLRVWDLRRGVELGYYGFEQPLLDCALRGEVMLCGDAAGTIRLIDRSDQPLMASHQGRVIGLAVNDQQVYSIGADQGLSLSWADNGQKESSLALVGMPSALCNAEPYLLIGLADGHLHCYDRQTRRLRWESAAHSAKINFLLPWEGGRLVSGGADGLIAAWNRVNGARLSAVAVGSANVRCGVLHQNWVVIGTQEGRLQAWDVMTGQLMLLYGEFGQPITALAGDGESLFAGLADGMIYQWRWDSDKPLRAWAGHVAPITALFCEGEGLYSADSAGQLALWDWAAGERLASYQTQAISAAYGLAARQGVILGDEAGGLQRVQVNR